MCLEVRDRGRQAHCKVLNHSSKPRTRDSQFANYTTYSLHLMCCSLQTRTHWWVCVYENVDENVFIFRQQKDVGKDSLFFTAEFATVATTFTTVLAR